MPDIIVIAHNIRSTHNVGALFRTADGFGVARLILSGYTPYPILPNDTRLPHIRLKIAHQIHKTALGAELTVPFTYSESLPNLEELREAGYRITALEQSPRSTPLQRYTPAHKTVLIIGEEVDGVPQSLLDECHDIIEIPMVGQKESFNVSVATGIALYALTSAEPTSE